MFDPANVELPMRTERLKECLAVIGWSKVELSRRLNVRPDTGPDLAKGRKNIPYVAALWIELLAHAFALTEAPPSRGRAVGDDMRPNDLAAALHEIGWTHNEFARRLNCSRPAVHLMLTQARPIGEDVAAWLRSAIRILQMTPLPAEWRSTTGLQNSKDLLETATGEGGTGTLNR